MEKKLNSGWLLIIVAICFTVAVCFMVCCSSCNKQSEPNINSEVDYGTDYRYIEVYSNGKNVLKLKGTIGVKTINDTTVLKTKFGKEYIFVNADVIIRQIDNKDSQDSQVSVIDEESQSSKEESKKSSTETSSRVHKEVSEVSERSRTESKVEESSKSLEASQVTISVSTSESSVSGVSNSTSH